MASSGMRAMVRGKVLGKNHLTRPFTLERFGHARRAGHPVSSTTILSSSKITRLNFPDPDDIRQPKPSDAKIISTTPLPPGEAKWTRLSRITYQAPDGRQRTWESAERTTRPQASQIDGVGIVAILERDTGPEILLQKQFRPPAGKVCIEVPAGLVDENETPEEAALRELREETVSLSLLPTFVDSIANHRRAMLALYRRKVADAD